MRLVSSTDIKDVFDVLIGNAVQMTTADRGRLIFSSHEGFTVVSSANRDGSTPAPEGEPIDEHQLSQASGTGEAVFAVDGKGLVIPIAAGDHVTAIRCFNKATAGFTHPDPFTPNAL